MVAIELFDFFRVETGLLLSRPVLSGLSGLARTIIVNNL